MSSSRWGNFFQQAVAGVESRLDTILAEDDDASKNSSKPKTDAPKSSAPPATSSGAVEELPQQSTPSKKNDRLQERLAKAVANRSTTGKSPEGSNPPSQSITPNIVPSSPRSSTDVRVEETVSVNKEDTSAAAEPNIVIDAPEGADPGIKLEVGAADQPRLSVDSSISAVSEKGSEPSNPTKALISEAASLEGGDAALSSDLLTQLRSDYEKAELRRQEEIHEYVERTEELHAKIQYLTKEILTSVQAKTEQVGAGSLEGKIAQRDEKIALLIEEGQKLSHNELKLMTTIKKLRAKAAEDEKQTGLSKASTEKAEKARAAALEKLKTAEAAQAEENQRVKQLEKDLERTRAELSSRSTKIGELNSQLNQAKTAASNEELTKTKKLYEEEKSKTTQLQEDLSTIKIEKKLGEDRHRVQVKELEENSGREKERARVADLELRGELAALEGRLETYRAQAEEISSGNSSDTQAKLFRQIETLQTQYSAASENWRGIETSLLARIAGLEKERDEVTAKETELRRKHREAGSKTRRAEEELEQANAKAYDLDEQLNKELSESAALRAELEKLQTEKNDLQSDLQSSQDQNKTLQQEIELKNSLSMSTPPTQHDATAMTTSGMKSSTDRSHLLGRRQNSSALGIKDLVGSERSASRKSSTYAGPNHFSPVRQDSGIFGSAKGSTTHTPSVQTEQQDDLFDDLATPATPERTINEMFSNSTAGAGPSVQLVERMSAAVRRLESEKAASKEEVDRLHAQRDEAREQVVSLMQEVEDKRRLDTKVAEFEAEIASLNQRYQTTLEMLGERSERVDELQADIADMKEIYKDTLEKNMR